MNLFVLANTTPHFIDYICCVAGKSPSTTGAGSEGALSKGPCNAIGATADLNNMLVYMIFMQYAGFSSAAGYIGPEYRIDHGISFLVPELWCRKNDLQTSAENIKSFFVVTSLDERGGRVVHVRY
jgi:hypothetical protein